jgi:DNA-binding PadR family transcriptional regulator
MSVRHALLALLREGPKYGLQLREEFEARTGEVWPLNVGQVYTTLQRLERDGLVESDDDAAPGPQKAFRITDGGARNWPAGCVRRRIWAHRRATSWSSRSSSRYGCPGSTCTR